MAVEEAPTVAPIDPATPGEVPEGKKSIGGLGKAFSQFKKGAAVAGKRLSEGAKVAGKRVSEGAAVVHEKMQPHLEKAGEKLAPVKKAAGEKIQAVKESEKYQKAAAATGKAKNSIVHNTKKAAAAAGERASIVKEQVQKRISKDKKKDEGAPDSDFPEFDNATVTTTDCDLGSNAQLDVVSNEVVIDDSFNKEKDSEIFN